MSFLFNTPQKTASGFTLPTSTPATTATAAPAGGFQFNLGSGDNKAPSLFGTPTTSAPTTGFAFGLGQVKTTANTSGFSTPTTQSAVTSAVSTGGLTLGTVAPAPATTNATVPSFSFGPPKTTTATSSGFAPILSSTTTATTSTGLSLSSLLPTTTSASQPKLQLISTTVATTTSAPALPLSTTSSASIAPTQTTTTTSTIPATGSLTFAQLEDSINKWTIDLEEQGKFFVNQAKQLNAWDSLLISNGEKILNLNGSIEKVKQQQQQLDQELDFVLAQQKELEELLMPLEKELLDTPVSDIDRNQMYQFSEVIDSQLKQISDDLKEIIENINESNKDEEISNPITQISKILNAHMNSLQWIDRNTSSISSQLEQISKIEDAHRRTLNFNNSFNNSMSML